MQLQLTAHIQRMRGGTIFTCVCLSTGSFPDAGPRSFWVGVPSPVTAGVQSPVLGPVWPALGYPPAPGEDYGNPCPLPYHTELGWLCGTGSMPLPFTFLFLSLNALKRGFNDK